MLRKIFWERLNILLVTLAMLVMFWSNNVAFSEASIVNGVLSEVSLPKVEKIPKVDVEPLSPDQTVINFDDVGAPCFFIETVALRKEYAHLGVTFEGPGPNDGGAILDECSNFGVTGHSPPNFLAFNSNATLEDGGIPAAPETIRFSPTVLSVRVNAGAGYPPGLGKTLRMEAYNSAGASLGSDSITLGAAMQTMSISAQGIAYVVITIDSPHTFVLDDLAFVQGVGPWIPVYNRIFKRTGSEAALPTLRRYRDWVLMADAQGKELVRELYEDHSLELAKILLTHPRLTRRGARMIKENLKGIKKTIDGGQMNITPAKLAEVSALLNDVGRVGSPKLRAYINSVQKVLQSEKALEPFGIKVATKIKAAPPRLKKGNLATTWGTIKRTR